VKTFAEIMAEKRAKKDAVAASGAPSSNALKRDATEVADASEPQKVVPVRKPRVFTYAGSKEPVVKDELPAEKERATSPDKIPEDKSASKESEELSLPNATHSIPEADDAEPQERTAPAEGGETTKSTESMPDSVKAQENAEPAIEMKSFEQIMVEKRAKKEQAEKELASREPTAKEKAMAEAEAKLEHRTATITKGNETMEVGMSCLSAVTQLLFIHA
jgi:hypothetical protein